jgi:CheY-like chemotaxis protein
MTAKLQILIVDANRTNLALMDMLARKLPNAATQLFTDPQAVLDQLGSISYDVAVFDAQLPGIAGIELVRNVKAHSRHSAKPVMIVSSGSDPACYGNPQPRADRGSRRGAGTERAPIAPQRGGGTGQRIRARRRLQGP